MRVTLPPQIKNKGVISRDSKMSRCTYYTSKKRLRCYVKKENLLHSSLLRNERERLVGRITGVP